MVQSASHPSPVDAESGQATQATPEANSRPNERCASRLLRDVIRTEWVPGLDTATAGVDRSSPVPLYVQIRRRLISMIAGWPDPTVRFPTDDELCRKFGVARMTVRAAIKEFVDAGLLIRTRGAGTMVAIDKVDEHVSPEMDFIDQWAHKGRPLSLAIRRYETVGAPEPFAHALNIETGTPVLFIERLRSAGPIPISLDYRYIHSRATATLTKEGAGQGSLLEMLQAAVPLSHADMSIEAGPADGAIADSLDLMPGDPLLLRGLVYMDCDDRAVMAGVSYYRSDQSGYSLRVPLSTRAGSAADDDARWGRIVQFSQFVGRPE